MNAWDCRAYGLLTGIGKLTAPTVRSREEDISFYIDEVFADVLDHSNQRQQHCLWRADDQAGSEVLNSRSSLQFVQSRKTLDQGGALS